MSRFTKQFVEEERVRALHFALSNLSKYEMIGMAASGYNYRYNAAKYLGALGDLMRSAKYKAVTGMSLLGSVLQAVDKIPERNYADAAYDELRSKVRSIIPGFVWPNHWLSVDTKGLYEQFCQWQRINSTIPDRTVIFIDDKKPRRSWAIPSLQREIGIVLQEIKAFVNKPGDDAYKKLYQKSLQCWLVDYLNEGAARGSKRLIALDLLDQMVCGHAINYAELYQRACDDQCYKTKIKIGGQSYWLREPGGRLGSLVQALCLLNDPSYQSTTDNNYQIVSPQQGRQKRLWFRLSEKADFVPTCRHTHLQVASKYAVFSATPSKAGSDAKQGESAVEMMRLSPAATLS